MVKELYVKLIEAGNSSDFPRRGKKKANKIQVIPLSINKVGPVFSYG